MSLKPPKKSYTDKKWMKSRRDRRILIQPEYHLIITEGTKTEPQYFNTIATVINKKYRGRVMVEVEGAQNNTLNLLDKAVKLVKNSLNVYSHVWVVYDTDDFPAEHINLTADRCRSISTDETKYHAVWSNQCIELWFLLHFDYFHSDIHRSEYYPKLTGYLAKIGAGEYQKNRGDIYQVLRPYMQTAVQNARRLVDRNEGRSPAASAPGTMVFELIEALKPYLGE